MNVMVTGGGGFLGRYIVAKLLERGDVVHSLGRAVQPDLAHMGVRVYTGDIAHADTVEQAATGCDAIVHVAAKAGVWGTWDSFYQPNVLGTRNVLQACQRLGIERLVYTSTPSVVFTGEAFAGADESLPYGCDWLCHYAHTKAIAEAEVLAANNTNRLRTIALRPHLIWGVGDNHLIPRILQRARTGRLRRVGDGANLVDITHVSNAAQAHIDALDALNATPSSCAGKAYFLSQGVPVNLWDWINQLLTRLQIPPVTRSISAKRAYQLGAILEQVYTYLHLPGEPPMTRFLAVELSKSHWYTIAAAQRELGYKVAVSTESGLDELVQHVYGKF